MTEEQKEKLTFIDGNIEQSPTPHNLASAVASIAKMLLDGGGEQTAAVDHRPVVIGAATAAVAIEAEAAGAAGAEDHPPMSEEDRKTFAGLMRRSADALEAGEEAAVRGIGQYLDGMSQVLGERRDAIMARIRAEA